MQKAIAVLDALAAAGEELGTNEIARRTGINASTVSRLLATLAGPGLVAHHPANGRYGLGIRILQLAGAARQTLDVRRVARPSLEDLAAVSGETATLSVAGEHDVMTLDFVQSPQSVRSVAEIGRNSVRHATAVGKVFLAHGGRVPDELTRFTECTITDHGALADEIRRVAEQGYAASRGEREPDLTGVAVPVLDRDDGLVAILGVQGPSGRLDDRKVETLVGTLREHARTVAGAF
ncbi:IclR family transcriptional regulator [Actinomycetospora cinnamomea]|uniref:Glycerol operon regulatory protein n=1 Tax=Actinomycetospora cinnamomea TaxID=663609 RepID=A0A2U1F461_9PSEU|nr:IclR family transcriptional regulator [Actinomycetospora cinnamomea]PVZ06957.1 IclR family transcriptional regulator [Actinomycetospora cinnamomea]